MHNFIRSRCFHTKDYTKIGHEAYFSKDAAMQMGHNRGSNHRGSGFAFIRKELVLYKRMNNRIYRC